MTRIEWPTATATFFLPIRRASRQYWADKLVSRLRAAAQAHPGQHLPQPAVAPGRLARAALAAGEVVARTAARPGGQVAGGREHRHVGADLDNDRLRGPLAHPGDGVQPVPSG